MASRAKRVLQDSLAGAAFGCAFIIAKHLIAGSFTADPAYNIGLIIGGALVGLVIGAIVGAVRRINSEPTRRAHTLSNPVDRTEWYVHDDAGQRGPLKKPEVVALLQQGLLRPESQVWRHGFTDWVPVEQVEEFVSSSSLRTRTGQESVRHRGPKVRGTFVARHWRGELSLPRSYWLNLLLITVFFFLVAFAGEALISPTDYPVAYASFWIAFWTLLALVQLWWIVGVWRSASRYAFENTRGYWGEVAKVVMVLSALSTIGTFATQGIPQVVEFIAVIRTYNSSPAYSLRILKDATELEISGPLDFGISRATANLLSDHPTIKTVHLNSDGGRLAEADALKDLVLSRQLNTYVARNCASACVTVFVAGSNRWLSRGAQLGLHSPYFPGSSEEEIKAVAKSTKAFFYSRSIAADVIERGFNTPYDDMWVPDHATIFASNLATSYATEQDVAASGITLQELGELETQLMKVNLFAAIKAGYPDEYRTIIQRMREGYLRGTNLSDLRVNVLPIVSKLYQKALPSASDSALLAFWELVLEQALVFREVSNDQCEAFLKGDAGKFDLQIIPSSLLQKEMEIGAALLRSRGTYSGEIISDSEAQPAFVKLLEAIDTKYGVTTERFLAGIEFKSTAQENCSMMLLLMQEGLKLDMADRLIVLRAMAQEAGREP
jgi:hypothetical protein